MTNNARELKAYFHEAEKKMREHKGSEQVYTFEMLLALKLMASNDVWPDGNFGDTDCNVWSLFRI